jgi:hypothetical protein
MLVYEIEQSEIYLDNHQLNTTHQLSYAGVLKMNVQALTLADECATIRSKINDLLLTDLPNGLVDSLDVVWDPSNLLDRSVMRDDHVLHLVVPELEVHKLTQEPRAHDLEFTSKDTAGIDIAVE